MCHTIIRRGIGTDRNVTLHRASTISYLIGKPPVDYPTTCRQWYRLSQIARWKFDDLATTIQQRLCDALYAAGRTKDAGESLFKLVNTFDEEVYVSGPITEWVSGEFILQFVAVHSIISVDFSRRCLSAPESDDDAARHDGAPMLRATSNSLVPTPLLREWAKATLARGSWQDALLAATSVSVSSCLMSRVPYTLKFALPSFTTFQAVCERLETIDCTTDASECFRQMVGELEEYTNVHDAEWVLGEWSCMLYGFHLPCNHYVPDFKRRCSGKLEGLGNTAMGAERHDDAISLYSAALSLDPPTPQGLFIKRSKAYIASGLWKDALNDANKVRVLVSRGLVLVNGAIIR